MNAARESFPLATTLALGLTQIIGYGKRQGQVMSVRRVVSSAAPFALAFMMENIGVSWALALTVAL